MSRLKVTLVQSHTYWHDPPGNRAHFDALFEGLQPEGGVVVLPEMFSTGFTMASAAVAEPMQGPTVAWMRRRAQALGCVLTGSLVIEERGRCCNRMIWAAPDGGLAHYDKRHLFRMAGEHECYQAGTQRTVVQHLGWRINLAVCYDLRFPAWLRNREDYDLLLFAANWPAARRLAWTTLLPARAVENLSYAAGVNVVGTDGKGVRYAGDSAIYAPDGQPLAVAGERAESLTATLDKTALNEYRTAFPAWRDADNFTLKP